MSVPQHDVSRRGRELPRLDHVVVPRWLRERRREQARAARPDVVAADITRAVLSGRILGRDLSFEELMRAQGVKPFDAEEHRRRKSPLTSKDWDELRAALAEARKQ